MFTYPLFREEEERTKSWWLIAVVGGLALLLFAFAQAASAQTYGGNGQQSTSTSSMQNYKHSISVKLTGDEETPPRDTAMTGRMIVQLSNDESKITYRLMVSRGQNITAAHFHCGKKGEAGPPIVNLYPMTSNSVTTSTYDNLNTDMQGVLAAGTVDESDLLPAAANCSPNIRTIAHLAQAMREGQIYVNVHTTRYPDGEIRGQVVLPNLYYSNGMNNNGNRGSNGNMHHANGEDLVALGRQFFSRIQVEETTAPNASSKRFMVTIPNDVWDKLVQAVMQIQGVFSSR